MPDPRDGPRCPPRHRGDRRAQSRNRPRPLVGLLGRSTLERLALVPRCRRVGERRPHRAAPV